MILLTDILFPTKYAKWRIEEIKAFIDTFQTDILVYKIDSYAGINYEVDYECMKEYFDLSKYNIIIFDSKYNYLNKYNTKIDGTKWNRKGKHSFLFTLSDTVDMSKYDTIYHIFLSSYQRFNSEYTVKPNKQFIHLYPGGGYSHSKSLVGLSKDVNVICTQPFTSTDVKSHKLYNSIDVYGSTLLSKTEKERFKSKNDSQLNICFSSMGQGIQKGSDLYTAVADSYLKLYPNDDVQFTFIGSTAGLTNFSKNVNFIKPMSQVELDDFYYHNVDILINTENGSALNGWPLGVEAALQGVVLITTDVHHSNNYFKYTNDMLAIIDTKNQTQIINIIKDLYNDRNKLLRMSNNIQKHSKQIFSYDNQQRKIFDFIKKSNSKVGIESYRSICPYYAHEDSTYKLKPNYYNPMQSSHVDIIHSNFKELIFDAIENVKPLTMTRYNDGEWISLLKIQDNKLYPIHFPKWGQSGQNFVDDKLFPIIENNIEYYIGISSEVMKKPYMMKHIVPYIKNFNIFDGGLFARMNLDGSFLQMLKMLKNRNVIVVGPEYLNKLASKFNFNHIKTNIKNVWNDYDLIHDEVKIMIDKLDNPVILYACSFVAKVLIDKFYHDYDNYLLQLDVGAALDVYADVNSRPWHGSISKE